LVINQKPTMNIKKIIILAFCLFLIGGLATSCTEEEVQPTNAGLDDWEKHNV
jgi:hypothetical protein